MTFNGEESVIAKCRPPRAPQSIRSRRDHLSSATVASLCASLLQTLYLSSAHSIVLSKQPSPMIMRLLHNRLILPLQHNHLHAFLTEPLHGLSELRRKIILMPQSSFDSLLVSIPEQKENGVVSLPCHSRFGSRLLQSFLGCKGLGGQSCG